MLSSKPLLGFILLAVSMAILLSCAVVVDETEHVIVTQFGRPVAVYSDAGLRLKLPTPLQRTRRLDKRLLLTETPETELLTADKKNVVTSTYISWKISDPLAYLKALRIRDAAEARLRALALSELGSALGEVPFSRLVSAESAISGLGELSRAVHASCRKLALRDFGIDIVDLGVTRFNFPSQNLQSVFGRMRAERTRIASGYRSEGQAEAQKVKALADRQKAELLADAEATAARLRGEGEAEAARIYADAYTEHQDFYRFTRTLESYEKVLNEKTTLILPGDSVFLDILMKRAGKSER